MNKKLIALVALISCTSTMVSAVSYQMMAGVAGLFGLATAGIVKRYKTVARRQVKQLIEDVKQIAALRPTPEQLTRGRLKDAGEQPSGYRTKYLSEKRYFCVSAQTVKAADLYLVKLHRSRYFLNDSPSFHHTGDRPALQQELEKVTAALNEQLKSYGMTETF